jgi:hypothetical protein
MVLLGYTAPVVGLALKFCLGNVDLGLKGPYMLDPIIGPNPVTQSQPMVPAYPSEICELFVPTVMS